MSLFQSFFAYIEGQQFKLSSYVLNSIVSFINLLESNLFFQAAVRTYQPDSIRSFREIKERIMTLMAVAYDTDVIHPYDSTIAAYLYLVYRSDPSRVNELTSLVRRGTLRNFWWTREMLNVISKSALTGSYTVVSEKFFGGHSEIATHLPEFEITSRTSGSTTTVSGVRATSNKVENDKTYEVSHNG